MPELENPSPEAPVPNGKDVPPPEPPKEEPKEPVSDKFAALARKEKGIVKARQELAMRNAEAQKREEAFKAQAAEFERWKQLRENAKIDPDSYLKEGGLDYGYLTERALKGGQDVNPIIQKMQAQIDALRHEQEEKEKKAQETQKTQAQQDFESRVQNFRQGIHDFVDQNADTYELVKLHGQQELIFQVIEEGARRKEPHTVKQAADKVEKYLEEQIDKALTTTKKFKDRMPKKEDPKPGSPTLNNNMTSTTTTNTGPISEAERTARALAALNKALGE